MAEAAENEALRAPGQRPGPRMDNPVQSNHIWSRRSFFGLAGWGGIATVFGIWGFAFTRFMFPRVLFEPSASFTAGSPEDFNLNEVSEKYKDEKGVWIVRDVNGGFYALLAVCTHLGCTPRWLQGEDKFKCPCHGSGFKRTGLNFEGPAPRPLERVKIGLNDEGELLIDKAVKFLKRDEWKNEEAYLKV